MPKLLIKREVVANKIFHLAWQSPFILLLAFTCACAAVFTLLAVHALRVNNRPLVTATTPTLPLMATPSPRVIAPFTVEPPVDSSSDRASEPVNAADYPGVARKALPPSYKKPVSTLPQSAASPPVRVKKTPRTPQRDFKVIERSLGIPL
ncbi:MAG: hypothetical protein RL122_1178 [Pseudomonadota bacterium]|jgi:hypothetical protein|uniref:Transmembrane protein n=1 Tax=Thiothrix fructosivorans TaxID=111770 RepID=A0A8B0SRK6_9GAMM|nr:hypothetical protein [Thiothrix fructosivorans]MBO0613031.1 hypothetical protein [Thiothrix fructosivorans]QTX11522.1 hypothetical protein J1836_003995 [Thiothrix fructosivorans]